MCGSHYFQLPLGALFSGTLHWVVFEESCKRPIRPYGLEDLLLYLQFTYQTGVFMD